MVLKGLTPEQAFLFLAPIVDAVPAASMGTASFRITAEGEAMRMAQSHHVSGSSLEELQVSLATVQAAMTKPQAQAASAGDITYGIRGSVHLHSLTWAQGNGIVDAAQLAPDGATVSAIMIVHAEE